MHQMLTDLFSMDMSVLEKVLRTVGVYAVMLVLIRVFGKRLMAQMNSQDLVVVLLLSNVVQNAIIGDESSLLGGTIGAITLVVVNWAVDEVAGRVPALARVLDGRPTPVVTDGRLDAVALRRLSITPRELSIALQEQGASRVEDVRSASIEPGGAILVQIEEAAQSASRRELLEEIERLQRHLDARLDRLEAR